MNRVDSICSVIELIWKIRPRKWPFDNRTGRFGLILKIISYTIRWVTQSCLFDSTQCSYDIVMMPASIISFFYIMETSYRAYHLNIWLLNYSCPMYTVSINFAGAAMAEDTSSIWPCFKVEEELLPNWIYFVIKPLETCQSTIHCPHLDACVVRMKKRKDWDAWTGHVHSLGLVMWSFTCSIADQISDSRNAIMNVGPWWRITISNRAGAYEIHWSVHQNKIER